MLRLQWYQETSLNQSAFSERFRHNDIPLLALRVVTARVLVVLNGFLHPKLRRDLYLVIFVPQFPQLRARFLQQIYHACPVLNPGRVLLTATLDQFTMR